MLTNVFEGGKQADNYADSILVNNTALVRVITVPARETWVVHSVMIFNADNVARAMSIYFRNSADKDIDGICFLQALGANANNVYPNTLAAETMAQIHPVLLVAGDYCRIVFGAGGASAGGTAHSSMISRMVKL